MNEKRVFTIRLEDNIARKIDELAKMEKTSKASVVKRALESFFAEKSENKDKISMELINKIKSLEEKHYLLVNRVNLLLKEIDNLKQRRK
jgi:metal-responsive CopG/Arc/MetJ family transcriptional regulator